MYDKYISFSQPVFRLLYEETTTSWSATQTVCLKACHQLTLCQTLITARIGIQKDAAACSDRARTNCPTTVARKIVKTYENLKLRKLVELYERQKMMVRRKHMRRDTATHQTASMLPELRRTRAIFVHTDWTKPCRMCLRTRSQFSVLESSTGFPLLLLARNFQELRQCAEEEYEETRRGMLR